MKIKTPFRGNLAGLSNQTQIWKNSCQNGSLLVVARPAVLKRKRRLKRRTCPWCWPCWLDCGSLGGKTASPCWCAPACSTSPSSASTRKRDKKNGGGWLTTGPPLLTCFFFFWKTSPHGTIEQIAVSMAIINHYQCQEFIWICLTSLFG